MRRSLGGLALGGYVGVIVAANWLVAHPQGGTRTGSIPRGVDYKAKDLLMIPAQLALALRADGWYLRDEIVWDKPAPMPTSAQDRTCRAHEMVWSHRRRDRGGRKMDAGASEWAREPQGWASGRRADRWLATVV